MNTSKIIVRNALVISLGIILYFFAMKLLGLENVSELRFLNFLFVLWGVNNAIRTNINKNGENLYISNFSVGVSTAALAVAITVVGLIIYVSFINPAFLEVLENSFLFGKNLTLPLVVFALLVEGAASSVICSFILMQYYKNFKPNKVTQ